MSILDLYLLKRRRAADEEESPYARNLRLNREDEERRQAELMERIKNLIAGSRHMEGYQPSYFFESNNLNPEQYFEIQSGGGPFGSGGTVTDSNIDYIVGEIEYLEENAEEDEELPQNLYVVQHPGYDTRNLFVRLLDDQGNPTPIAEQVVEWVDDLENYPILDDDHHNEYEQELIFQGLENELYMAPESARSTVINELFDRIREAHDAGNYDIDWPFLDGYDVQCELDPEQIYHEMLDEGRLCLQCGQEIEEGDQAVPDPNHTEEGQEGYRIHLRCESRPEAYQQIMDQHLQAPETESRALARYYTAFYQTLHEMLWSELRNTPRAEDPGTLAVMVDYAMEQGGIAPTFNSAEQLVEHLIPADHWTRGLTYSQDRERQLALMETSVSDSATTLGQQEGAQAAERALEFLRMGQ